MNLPPTPPQMYQSFLKRYPKVGQAREMLSEAGKDGPLDERTSRLLKLAISVGAMREGAVHSNVRKALAMGILRAEIEQVVALAASTLGLPSAVAVFSWIADEFAKV